MANLLLVDDDPVLLDLIARLLRRAGHVVSLANHAAEGLALAQAQPFDVIITDVMMPETDGYAFTRQLRAQLPSTQTRIVIFTARLQGPDKALAREAGADACLMKTVNIERLNTLIESLLKTEQAGR
jgi:two-component system, sensor histidine kinase ChiS